jgi:hypothetical protein
MKIEHPNFQNQNEPSQSPQQKVHTVMPPHDENAFMQEMSQLVQQVPENQAPAPLVDDAVMEKQLAKKSVLEKLVMFKQPHYKEVELSGVVFRLKILNADENAKVYNMIRDLPAEEQLTRSPIIMLAASLVDANGVRIEDTYNGPEIIDDPMVRRYNELCHWHMPVINALVAAYREFSGAMEKEYSKDFLAKSPETASTD